MDESMGFQSRRPSLEDTAMLIEHRSIESETRVIVDRVGLTERRGSASYGSNTSDGDSSDYTDQGGDNREDEDEDEDEDQDEEGESEKDEDSSHGLNNGSGSLVGSASFLGSTTPHHGLGFGYGPLLSRLAPLSLCSPTHATARPPTPHHQQHHPHHALSMQHHPLRQLYHQHTQKQLLFPNRHSLSSATGVPEKAAETGCPTLRSTSAVLPWVTRHPNGHFLHGRHPIHNRARLLGLVQSEATLSLDSQTASGIGGGIHGQGGPTV
ncbi:hypothetical protein BGW38_004394, partial [Lunasporangiospora selenospora]